MRLRIIYEEPYNPNSAYDPDDGIEFEDVISPQNLNGWKYVSRPITVYKATNTPGVEIPGFCTIDIEEAKSYHGGGDWGGKFLVKIDIGLRTGGAGIDLLYRTPTQQNMTLDGREGPILIEAGVKPILKRGTEVIILVPVRQEILENSRNY